jgi:hypothetical protein
MERYLNIADKKGRNASIKFGKPSLKSGVKLVTAEGNDVHTVKVIKSTSEQGYENLLTKFKDAIGIAEALVKENPEIDLKMTGRMVSKTTKVYVDNNLKPVFRIQKIENVYNPDGSLKEERAPKELTSNILIDFPLRPGKLFPKADIYNKLVFARKYQLKHVNGLTFDFLFEMVKELHDSNSLMMLGGGEKGTEPLVFQDGGKSYRAFLEGRIKGDSYLLLLHLSNLELKSAIG